MKLSILHKGLILLLIPAMLQGFLLFQLYASFQEVDRLLNAERKVSEAIETGDEIVHLVTQVLRTVWRTGKPSSDTLISPEAFRSRMNFLIEREQELLGSNVEMQQTLKLLGPLSDDAFNLLSDVWKADEPNSDFERIISIAPRIRMLAQKQDVIQTAKNKELAALRQKREDTRASLARVKGQIFFSAFAEIALILVLLFYFLQDVTKRLRVLMINAASVPKGKPLTKRVSGGDELSYLDDVLHEASQELDRAAQHRKTLTEMVSHDLRSPLLSANLSLDQLLRDQDVPDSREELNERVHGIKKNLTRLTSFVEDLLAIDRLESGSLKLSLEIVDMRELADEVIDSMSVLAQAKNLTLKNELTKQEVVADKNRLHQVLVNLISNAIKFSPNESVVLLSAQTTNQMVTVSVIDKGPGISNEDQARLFEKFHQVESPNLPQGYGLGLFICKLIVEKHDGKLGVESQPGKGSRFWFSLPLDDSEDP